MLVSVFTVLGREFPRLSRSEVAASRWFLLSACTASAIDTTLRTLINSSQRGILSPFAGRGFRAQYSAPSVHWASTALKVPSNVFNV